MDFYFKLGYKYYKACFKNCLYLVHVPASTRGMHFGVVLHVWFARHVGVGDKAAEPSVQVYVKFIPTGHLSAEKQVEVLNWTLSVVFTWQTGAVT